MRDTGEVKREMFEARQDLETNLARLVHKVREQVAVGARVRHSLRKLARRNGLWMAIFMTSLLVGGAAMVLSRPRSR